MRACRLNSGGVYAQREAMLSRAAFFCLRIILVAMDRQLNLLSKSRDNREGAKSAKEDAKKVKIGFPSRLSSRPSRLRGCIFLLLCCAVVMPLTVLAAEPATTQSSLESSLPTLYIIGDSTVHNTDKGLCGWGDVIGTFFDPAKITVENHAIGGRSSRTFFTEGRWDKVMEALKPGDFVLMQFGHNDGGAINDTSRARGSIRGIGDDTQEIDNDLTHKHEVVHTFGWYMRKYVTDAKSKGATPIVCSLVPRNMWKDGKVIRSADSYQLWARQIADEQHVPFIDLNEMIAEKYEQMGTDKTTALFPGDHTHTSPDGAKLNAQTVVEGIKGLKDCALASFLLSEP